MLSNSDPQNAAAETETHQTSNIVPISCCPMLVSLCLEWFTQLLQGLLCLFRDALLNTLVVASSYLNYWITFISAKSSLAIPLWPLASTGHFYTDNCCSLDIFSVTPCDHCVGKTQQVSSFSEQAVWCHPWCIQGDLNHFSSSFWGSIRTPAGHRNHAYMPWLTD